LYQTSTSEREHGEWNEGFEFRVTYHAQLFDSLQVEQPSMFNRFIFFLLQLIAISIAILHEIALGRQDFTDNC
jgi:hypothetical protein